MTVLNDVVTPAAINRLLDKAVLVGDCWEFTGCRNWGGYGRVKLGGKAHSAHRVVYHYFRNEIPSGLDIDHLCRNRACVNPWHLEPVTRQVNTIRGSGGGYNFHPHIEKELSYVPEF